MAATGSIYFASDVHLGLIYRNSDPRERERLFVDWLTSIEADCEELFLLGDIFDFWFEWRKVVPRGFTRLLGKLAQMSDQGIAIHFFAGNHDLWLTDYFTTEIGAKIYTEPHIFERYGHRLFLAHGDALGKSDLAGRFLSSTFRSKVARWLFSRFIHPDIALDFGHGWSRSNRHNRGNVSHQFRGEDENIVRYARTIPDIDIFIFGHLHTPIIYPLSPDSQLVVLGEWIENPTFARLTTQGLELISYK